MTDAANLVLRSISDSAAEDGTIRPRLAHLRESTELSATDIFVALFALEDAGQLVKAEPGPGLFRLVLAEPLRQQPGLARAPVVV